MRFGIEDDGGGHHRTGERTAAGLVAARDRPDALRLSARALAAERRAEDFLAERQALGFGGGGANSSAAILRATRLKSMRTREFTAENGGENPR